MSVTEQELLDARESALSCVWSVSNARLNLAGFFSLEKDIRKADLKLLTRVDGEVRDTFIQIKRLRDNLAPLLTPELVTRLETSNLTRAEGLRVKVGKRDVTTFHAAALAKIHSFGHIPLGFEIPGPSWPHTDLAGLEIVDDEILDLHKPDERLATLKGMRAWLWNLREQLSSWTFAIDVQTHENRIREETARAIAHDATNEVKVLTEVEDAVWRVLAGEILDSNELGRELGCKPSAVRRAIKGIRQKGKKIETQGRQGYYRPDHPPASVTHTQVTTRLQ